MFSFLNKKPQEQTHIVVMVTSSTITAAVVRVFKAADATRKPVVLFSCESIIPIRNNQADYRDDTVRQGLRTVLNKCRTYYPVYQHIYCCVGEPWILSSTRTAHLEKKESFAVTQKLIDDLVVRETKLFEQEIARDYANQEPVGLLEVSRPLVDANGYRVHHIHGIKASTIDVHLTFSIVSLRLATLVVDVCGDVFHRTDVRFASCDLAKIKFLNQYPEGTLIELGGATLPVLTKDRQSITATAVIPVGVHQFMVKIMQLFDVTQQGAFRALSFAIDENILVHDRERYFHRIIEAYETVRPSIVRYGLEITKHMQQLPKPVMIIGHNSSVSLFKEFLERDLRTEVIVLDNNLLLDQVVVSHEARVCTYPLLLAIMHVIQYD